MKSWIFIPVALLLGLLIGSWGPRSDLNEMRREVRRSRKLLSKRSRGRSNLQGVTRLLGIESHASASRPASTGISIQKEMSPVVATAEDPNTTSVSSVEEAVTNNSPNSLSATHPDKGEQRNMETRINEAMELWKTRSDIARSTLMANLHLSPSQAVKFDVLVAAMNVRIGAGLQTFADALEEKDEMLPEDGIRLADQVTSSIVVAYDEMDRSMPKGWRKRARGNFDMTDFIDPNVARPLLKVENKLQPRRRAWGKPAPDDNDGIPDTNNGVLIHD